MRAPRWRSSRLRGPAVAAALGVVLALVAGCGEQVAPGELGHVPIALQRWKVVAEQRIGPTAFEYELRADCANAGDDIAGAAFLVRSRGTATTVLDGNLRFGPIASKAHALSLDTIRIRHDRAQPFDPRVLEWVALSFGPNTKSGQRRFDANRFDFTYFVHLINGTREERTIGARVASTAPTVTAVLDARIAAESVPELARRGSGDRFTIRHDRSVAFDPTVLVWDFDAEPGASDERPPGVRITAPTQVQAGSAIQIGVAANDDVGVAGVELFVDGLRVATSDEASMVFFYTASDTPGGALRLRGLARDAAGNVGEATAQVEVVAEADATPPVIEALVLPPEAAAGTSFIARAVVSDDRGVAEVRFSTAGSAAVVVRIPPYSARLEVPPGAPVGSVVVVDAEAVDGAGLTAQADGQVLVAARADTASPTGVTLVSPAEAPAGLPIEVAATASDDVGVASVAFLADGVALGEDADAPYTLTTSIPATARPGDEIVWTARALDFAGNATSASATTRVSAAGSGFAMGEVYDDGNGRPLAGVTVRALPQGPETTTDARGRYALALPEGRVVLALARNGYTPAWREVDLIAGSVRAPLDARLVARAAGVALTQRDGGTLSVAGATLLVPPGALVADGPVALTPLSGQSLPAPLPLGWAPLAAFEVEAGAASLVLDIAGVEADRERTIAARFDAATRRWRRVVHDDGTSGALRVAIEGAGTFAIARRDAGALAPPLAALGEALAGVGAQVVPNDVAVEILPNPRLLFATVDARANVTARLDTDAALPSGTALEVHFDERYRRVDDTALVPPPMAQDVLLYAGAGGPEARFVASPPPDMAPESLREGTIDLAARIGANVAGAATLDATGGAVAAAGVRAALPAGALAVPAPVAVRGFVPSDPALQGDERFDTIGGIELDLGGARLASAAALALAVPAGVTITPDDLVLVVQPIVAAGATRYAIIALARLEGDELVADAAAAPASLPLPGVREGDRYAFVRLAEPAGFVTGGVVTSDGAPAADALVSAHTLPFVSRTRLGDARYVVAASLGPARVAGLDLQSGDGLEVAVVLPERGAIVVRDLALGATRPRVVSVEPADGATGVPVLSAVTVRFDRPMNAASLAAGGATLAAGGTPLAATVALSADRRALVLRPSVPLASETLHALHVAATLTDAFGQPLEGDQPDGAFASAFTTADTTPPPRPEAGQIDFESVTEGRVRVTGTQGAAEPGAVVSLVNRATGAIVTVLADADGSFALELDAGFLDGVDLRLRDAAGNETIEGLDRVDPPPGIGVVGAAGGFVEGAGGLGATIPPAVLGSESIVRIEPLDVASVPAPPFPAEDGIEVAAAARLELGGAEIPDPVQLRFEVAGRRALGVVDEVPLFEVDQPLVVPADAPPGAPLVLRVIGVNARGDEETLEVELPIVASAPDATRRRVASNTNPVVSIELPREATPGQSVPILAKVEYPDLKVRFPADPSLTGGEQLLVWDVREVAGKTLYNLVDSASLHVESDGSRYVETNSPPFRGIRRNVDQLVLTLSREPALGMVRTLRQATLMSGSGIGGVITAIASDGVAGFDPTIPGVAALRREVLGALADVRLYEFDVVPVRGGAPATIVAMDLATNTRFAAKNLDALAPGAFSEVVVLGEDGNAPVVTGTTSAVNGNVPVDAGISVSFSHPIDRSSIGTLTLFLEDDTGTIVEVEYLYQEGVGPGGTEPITIIRLQPLAPLRSGALYTLKATTGIKRVGGLELAREFSMRFMTGAAPVEIGRIDEPGAREFDVHGERMVLAISERPGANEGSFDNAVKVVNVEDPSFPFVETTNEFDPAHEGTVRDVRILPESELIDSGVAFLGDLVAASVGDEQAFSTVRLLRLDDLGQVGGAVVGTDIEVLQESDRLAVISDIGAVGTNRSLEVFSPLARALDGIPELPATPTFLEWDGAGIVHFVNIPVGVATLDVRRAVPPPPTAQRGSQLGPTYAPIDKTGFVVVSPDPSFSQSTSRLVLSQPAGDPSTGAVGPFVISGLVPDPDVARVVVNTVDAELADPSAAGGPRTFSVTLRLRHGINPIVATPFDETGAELEGAVAARVVVPGPPGPFQDPGTISTDFAPVGGYVLLDALPGALTVNASVQETARFDAIFVNGQQVSVKTCPIGTNPANQSCGWPGTGTTAVSITQPVQSVVATAIDTDPSFVDFVGVATTDLAVRDGLVATIGRGSSSSDRLRLLDASSLAPISDVPAPGAFRVSLAPRVSVDLDQDGRTGAAENRDGDDMTSWDELRSLAIVGGFGLRIVDVTNPATPQTLGQPFLASSLGGSTFKAFTLADKDLAYVAASSRVVVIDLRRAVSAPTLSASLVATDPRIVQSIPISGGIATDVYVDEQRRLLYVLLEGVGVRIFQLGCDQDVGVDATHRPVPLENPFNSDDNLRADLQFSVQRGLGEPACSAFTLTPTQTASAALLAQGSSACLWREDGICGSAFQRANSDYDFHLVYEDLALGGAAPACAAAIASSIRNEDAQGDPLPPLPRGSVFRDVTVFPVELGEMAAAYRESDLPCGAPGDPDGDLCLGRTGLMLKWFLESEFVYGAGGPTDRFDLEFDLESGLRGLARPRPPDDAAFVFGNAEGEPTHVPLAEGLEWACQSGFNFEKSGARFRIAGAGPPGANDVEWPFFLNEIHKVGKAGIRAVFGRLLSDPATNRLLLTTSRRDFNSGSGCNTAFDFANGALPTNLDDFGYKRCESFEEYVASTAIQSVKRRMGPLSGADALRAFEMFRMKSDVGPAIADEVTANAFILRARDLIARIQNATDVNQSFNDSAPRYIDFSQRQANLQNCQARTADTKANKLLEVPLRAFNGGYVQVPDVALKAYQDGGEIEERRIGLVGGEDRLFGRKNFRFAKPGPGQLRAADFVIDPENQLTEYDKENNHSGFFYYYLEDNSEPAPPSTPNGTFLPPLPPGVDVPQPRSEVCAAPPGHAGDLPVPGLEFSLSTAALPFGTNGLPGRGSAANREGQEVELRWTIANTGNVDLNNIVVETSVPCSGGAPVIGSLAAGAIITPTCRVVVPAGGALVLSTISAEDANGVSVGANSAAVELQAIDPGEPSLDPVIFVPGMAGSVLRDGGPNGPEHWPGGDKEELSLDPNDPNFTASIVATDAMRAITIQPLPLVPAITMDIYGNFLRGFTQGSFGHELYVEYAHQDPINRSELGCIVPGAGASKPTLFVFPWDWRAGVEPAVQQLADYVRCVRRIHGDDARIHMVGHSMGGLVARRYVLAHPDEISKVVTLGTPYLGAPKGTYVMQTGDFIGVPGVVQAIVLIAPGLLRSLTEFFPGAHELLPSATYFDFVDPLAAPVGTSPFATSAGDANHSEFRRALDVGLYPTSRPVARNMALHGLPGMADWRDESVQSLYHIVYGADSAKTIQKIRIRNSALLRFLVNSGSSLAGDAVSAEANPIAGAVAENALRLASGFVLPVSDTQTLTGLRGDGTVPAASSLRIQPPNPGTSPNLVNLNAPTAELWRVPTALKQDHNEMLGEATVQKYVISVLQPHRVTLSVPERRTACAASRPTTRDISNDSGCLAE